MSSTTDIINQIIENAMITVSEKSDAATDAATSLISRRAGAYIIPPSSSSGFAVSAIEPEIPTVDDSTLKYDAELDRIVALLSGQLANFFATYYPLASDAFDEATSWMINVISNGGTGINAAVEDAIWQRARERVVTDGRRVENQIVTGYAAKGYTLVAGAMLQKLEESRYDQAGKSGEASTTIAAKQIDVEIATVKFAIEEAIKSRTMAMSAAADYIRAIAVAPAAAATVAGLNTDAQARMMAAAATWYGARLDRDKIILSSKLAELSSRDDVFKLLKTNATQNSQVDVQALTSALDVFGKMIQAALLSLNSVVSATENAFS